MQGTNSNISIVTWDVNGLKSLSTNHSEIKEALDALEADVICFQEIDVSESALKDSMTVVEGYNSYFDFPRRNLGDSGVATYCRDDFSTYKSEEGISEVYYREKLERDFFSKEEVYAPVYDYTEPNFCTSAQNILDYEGRAVITQHKCIVPGSEEMRDLAVINIYCPKIDPRDTVMFSRKMKFYELLGQRIQGLQESGSHIIVVGDINTARRPIDHCDPRDMVELHDDLYKHFLNHLVWDPEKGNIREPTLKEINLHLLDAYRHIHPKGENVFTRWSTQLISVVLNYNSQFSFILIDDDLKLSIKECSILREVDVSKHCPVRIVLNLNSLHSQSIPFHSTVFYKVFSSKQKKVSDFYKNTYTDITKGQYKEEQENSDPFAEKKSSPSKAETKCKKVIEGFVTKQPVMHENVCASSTLHGTETASSHSHNKDCLNEKNTKSIFSATVKGKRMDVNLPSTSYSTPSVQHEGQVPALNLDDDPLGLVIIRVTTMMIWTNIFKGLKFPPSCTSNSEP